MAKVIIRMRPDEFSVTFYDRDPPEVVDVPSLSPPDRKYIPEEILKRSK